MISGFACIEKGAYVEAAVILTLKFFLKNTPDRTSQNGGGLHLASQFGLGPVKIG